VKIKKNDGLVMPKNIGDTSTLRPRFILATEHILKETPTHLVFAVKQHKNPSVGETSKYVMTNSIHAEIYLGLEMMLVLVSCLAKKISFFLYHFKTLLS